MDFPNVNKMKNQELILILIILLVVFGIVSAFVTIPNTGFSGVDVASFGGCCGPTMTMSRLSLDQEMQNLTFWNILKFAEDENIANPDETDVKYYVNVTEVKTEDNLLVFTGKVSIRNTGSSTAYLGNVVNKLHEKPSKHGTCTYTGAVNVVTYNETYTTVDTCDIVGSGSISYTHSNDGNLTLVDQYSVDPFATNGSVTSGLYAIPAHTSVILDYTSTFDLDLVGVSSTDFVSDELIVTFIQAPGGGPNTCSAIDATGDGYFESGTHQSRAWPETIQKFRCKKGAEVCDLPSVDTSNVVLKDMISDSPDQEIVSVDDFEIDSFFLDIDGGNIYDTVISATGTPGTTTTIELNSGATCTLPEPDCGGDNVDLNSSDSADEVLLYEPGLRKNGSPLPASRNDSSKALGLPQNDDTLNFVSLGMGGNLTLKFNDAIVNKGGDDLQVVETSYNDPTCSSYPEWVEVYASKTGHPGSWEYLGTHCQNESGTYDLGSLDWAQYIKLVDVSDPDDFSGSGDGFDVDGIIATTCPIDEYVGGGTSVENKAWLEFDNNCCENTCNGYGYDNCDYTFCENGYGYGYGYGGGNGHCCNPPIYELIFGSPAYSTINFACSPVDYNNPVITEMSVIPDIFNNGATVTYSANVTEDNALFGNTVLFSCTDGSTYSFDSDACTGSAPNFVCSKTVVSSEPDGLYNCTAYAEDLSGNNDTSAEVPIIIDSTPPDITTSSGPTVVIGTPLDFSITNGVYDELLIGSEMYQKDGGAWTPFSSPYDVPTIGFTVGEHCFNVTANDTAGNTNKVEFCFNFVTTIPPNGGDGDKTFQVSRSQVCPGDLVTFTAKHGSNPVNGADVKLLIYNPAADVVDIIPTNVDGEAQFNLTVGADYEAEFTKSGFKKKKMPFTYTMCPPTEPPGGCVDNLDCVTGYICDNGECVPSPEPECITDSDCADDYFCNQDIGKCEEVTGICGHAANHSWNSYECCSDDDCEQLDNICIENHCELPGIKGTPPDPPIVGPNETIILDFTIENNGTTPLHNVHVTFEDFSDVGIILDTNPDVISVLEPGGTALVSVTMHVRDDVEPGLYGFGVVYGSDEKVILEQFGLSVAQEVVPGVVWADLCLPVGLLALLLALLYWFFIMKKGKKKAKPAAGKPKPKK
jgi:hypothetical protein